MSQYHSAFSVTGFIVDVLRREIFPGRLHIKDGIIVNVERVAETEVAPQYILMGFVDAHVHIESSLLTPLEFARLAVRHGTVGAVSDPHEIVNPMEKKGMRFMVENGAKSPLKHAWMVPSCVPATNANFETSGASIGVEEVRELLGLPDVYGLAEVMNFPAVLARQDPYMTMIADTLEAGKVVDGHFPAATAAQALSYAEPGISTCHESITLEEAQGKLRAGMKVIIREGSAAKNYNALRSLLAIAPQSVMFCTDDCHPHELFHAHIDALVRRAVQDGYELFDVLRAASLNPVEHYGLPVGRLQTGDPADFIVVKDLTDFKVLQTYIDGVCLAQDGHSLIASQAVEVINHFVAEPIALESLQVRAAGDTLRVIEVLDGQLFTKAGYVDLPPESELVESDVEQDVLKLVVVNRYERTPVPQVAFVRGFKLRRGALAGSVAHDSHNVVAVGTSDEELLRVINHVISLRGGLAVTHSGEIFDLPLPIAGLMSDRDGFKVAKAYDRLLAQTRTLGSSLHDPMMMLSFLALIVIPRLKLSDKGLFDVDAFRFVDLFVGKSGVEVA